MKERVSLRRMTAFFTSILLVVFCLPTLALPAKAETTVRQVNNIVLFAQFDPLTEKNFMSGDATNTVLSMCNDTTTYRSLTKYIDTISYGQMHVDSYFPQLKDGVIEPYVLSQSRESYTDYNQYAVEMIQNIAIPADIPLDGDNDGYIDNIVCVVDGKVTSAADPLWSKAFYLDGGLQVNGLTVGQVNLHSGYSVIGSTLFNGIGTVCHEFLHSMGYPDLYHRSDVPGDPVGQWDIMATTSIFLQYPLAYQRYSVSGWMGAETITTAGTYALAPASSSEGSRLYLLKTPLSDTEFFAVEYRKQGAKYSDELDGKIYGDGMVVYRVNTSVVGNYRGDTDQIYIFRPGETALNGGAGDLTKSCYGGTGAPNHIGTTDLQKKFSDGALVYADGTNSGIALDNIQIQDNGTLTFSVSFADLSGQKLWETSNNSSFSADTMAYDLATAADGTMYLLSTTAYSATLYRVEEDETLTAVSKPFSGSMYNPKLVICDGTAYVLYQDYDYFSHLCKWNENGQLWEECYVGTKLAQYQDLATDGEQLYFTCTTGSFPYALQAYCYNPNTGQATQIGTDLSGNACNMEIAAADGTVVIGYRDLTANSVPKAAIYNGATWNIITLSEQECGMVSVIAKEDGKFWVLPSGGKNPIFSVTSDGTATAYAVPEQLKENVFQMIPVLSGGNLYVAVNSQNPNAFDLYRLNQETASWETVGNTIANEIVNQPVLSARNGTIYCMYNASEQILLKKLVISKNEETILKGDLNLDGRRNLADTVLFHRYLLRTVTLTEEQGKRAETVEDGTINIIDLIWLKQAIHLVDVVDA